MFTFDRWFQACLGALVCIGSAGPVLADPQLTIQPKTCVRDASGACQTTLKIEYTDEQRRAVCIAIRHLTWEECHEEAKRHVVDVEVDTQRDLSITALDAGDRRILGEAKLILATFKPDATRKRRRFSWSY